MDFVGRSADNCLISSSCFVDVNNYLELGVMLMDQHPSICDSDYLATQS